MNLQTKELIFNNEEVLKLLKISGKTLIIDSLKDFIIQNKAKYTHFKQENVEVEVTLKRQETEFELIKEKLNLYNYLT